MSTEVSHAAERMVSLYRGAWPPTSFMARLDPRMLDALVVGRRTVRFSAGEDLLVEGSPSTEVFMLISAVVKVTARLDSGSALLAIRLSGDLVGEFAATDGEVRSATVTAARDDTIAVRIQGAEFLSIVERDPATSRLLMAVLARKVRAANRRRVDISAYRVPVRVARVLVELAEEYGLHVEKSPLARTLRIGLSQIELATLVGAGEASVVDALKHLRSEHIVEWGYRTVTIHDMRALRIAGRITANDP